MNHRDFFKVFKYELCGDEVEHAKPSPEIFQRAAAKLGDFDPKHVLVFEDAVNGVKAACSAEMASVLIEIPNVDYECQLKEMEASASLIITGFDQFDFSVFQWAK